MAWNGDQQWYGQPPYGGGQGQPFYQDQYQAPGYYPSSAPPHAGPPEYPSYPMVVIPQQSSNRYHEFQGQSTRQYDGYVDDRQQYSLNPPPPPRYSVPALPQYQSQPAHPAKPNVSSRQPAPVPSVAVPPRKPVITNDLPVDYRLLLLSLADQYINEAHAMSSPIALRQPGVEKERYYKLIAAGLGCYEAVLKKHWKLPPRQEALIQLRYANLLYEDTENDLEVESLLTRGVTFCERNRLVNLKYTMQHLLARCLYKTNVTASIKHLEKVIQEAEACQHIAWVYALRFLRVSLSLQMSKPQHNLAALQHLKIISNLSKNKLDVAVNTMCAVLEAVVHLRIANTESIDEAQRAIAVVRAQQLNETAKTAPQISAFVNFLDLACSLDPYKYGQAQPKMQSMQKFLDEASNLSNWRKDGIFLVPLQSSTLSDAAMAEAGGVFIRGEDGLDNLTFSWLPRTGVYSLGFLLSAVALYSKNPSNGQKSEKYLKEGLKMTLDAYYKDEVSVTESLSRACTMAQWRLTLRCHMLAHLTFARCERSDWTLAKTNLDSLQDLISTPGLVVSESLSCLVAYLVGVIHQGSGNLKAALNAYQIPSLTLPESASRIPSKFRLDLSILATLNILFIIRSPSHPSHHLTTPLLDRLSPHLTTTASANSPRQNPHLQAAHTFLLSTLTGGFATAQNASITTDASAPAPPKITTTKQHLQASLSLAKSLQNSQLLTLCLAYMCHAFFQGIVGDQAVQAARAARKTAQEAGAVRWVAVAGSMLEQTLRVSDRGGEVEAVREEWVGIVEKMEKEQAGMGTRSAGGKG